MKKPRWFPHNSRDWREGAYIMFLFVFATCLISGGLALARFQFNLCYPVVSPNVWYCLQHAF